MASAFSFGFSGDDIDMEVDEIEVEAENVSEKPNAENANAPNSMFPAVKHELKDWVCNLS